MNIRVKILEMTLCISWFDIRGFNVPFMRTFFVAQLILVVTNLNFICN